jgi:hypothetical protein
MRFGVLSNIRVGIMRKGSSTSSRRDVSALASSSTLLVADDISSIVQGTRGESILIRALISAWRRDVGEDLKNYIAAFVGVQVCQLSFTVYLIQPPHRCS